MTLKPALQLSHLTRLVPAAVASAALLLAMVPHQAAASNGRWLHEDHEVVLGYGCTPFELEPFDPRFNCPDGFRVHEAIDFDTPEGTRVYAGLPGTVLNVGGPETHDYGSNYVRMLLGDGHDLILGHLGSTVVKTGDALTAGQLIGFTGTLGVTNWPNLHFEVRPHGGTTYQSINPAPYLTLSSAPPPASAANPSKVHDDDSATMAPADPAGAATGERRAAAPATTLSGTDPAELVASLVPVLPAAPVAAAAILLVMAWRRRQSRRLDGLSGSWT